MGLVLASWDVAKHTANKYASEHPSAQIQPHQAFSGSQSTHIHDKEMGWEIHFWVESKSQNRMEAKPLCLENYNYLHFNLLSLEGVSLYFEDFFRKCPATPWWSQRRQVSSHFHSRGSSSTSSCLVQASEYGILSDYQTALQSSLLNSFRNNRKLHIWKPNWDKKNSRQKMPGNRPKGYLKLEPMHLQHVS